MSDRVDDVENEATLTNDAILKIRDDAVVAAQPADDSMAAAQPVDGSIARGSEEFYCFRPGGGS